ncbi:MAG: hypothetical protein FWB87_15535 [Defluviitaleaceae bacterium]|nr:hypothetical protein [Defluviitaleaceae bacterium]
MKLKEILSKHFAIFNALSVSKKWAIALTFFVLLFAVIALAVIFRMEILMFLVVIWLAWEWWTDKKQAQAIQTQSQQQQATQVISQMAQHAVEMMRLALAGLETHLHLFPSDNKGFISIRSYEDKGVTHLVLRYKQQPNAPIVAIETCEEVLGILNFRVHLVLSEQVLISGMNILVYPLHLKSSNGFVEIIIVPLIDVAAQEYVANHIVSVEQRFIVGGSESAYTMRGELYDAEL